jgi:carbamate kinase
MNQYSFNDDDKKKLVDFLNFVAKNARFEVNTQEIIEYFKLLSYMQGNMLPKIEANILEVSRIIPALAEDKPKKSK